MRDFARNLILNYLPAIVAHKINVLKNVHLTHLEPEMGILCHLLQNNTNKVALDVGANLGLYSELLSPIFKHVIAIEPQPKLAKYLQKILPANVILVESAASDHQGRSVLRTPKTSQIFNYAPQLDALASLEESNELNGNQQIDEIEVRLETLDTISAHCAEEVGFIKIDVEGHELKVLMGAHNVLTKFKPMVMVEIDRHMNEHYFDVFKLMQGGGYYSFYLNPKNGRITPCNQEDVVKLQADEEFKKLRSNKPAPGYISNFIFSQNPDLTLAN